MAQAVETIDNATPIRPEADLHSHILPALDDGARDLAEAVAMARRAVQSGIRRIVTTPHVARGGEGLQRAHHLPALAAHLQSAARQADLGVEFVSAAELTLTGDLVEQIGEAPWLTVGGQRCYVLVMVEAPFRRWPRYIDELIFRLALRRITPIICHPERLPLVQREPEVLAAAVDRGARLQITAASLAKEANKTRRRCAHRLLRLGLVSLIASDAHGEHDPLPGDVAGAVVAAVGAPNAYRILVENPRLVLAGEPVPPPEPPSSRPAWVGRFSPRKAER